MKRAATVFVAAGTARADASARALSDVWAPYEIDPTEKFPEPPTVTEDEEVQDSLVSDVLRRPLAGAVEGARPLPSSYTVMERIMEFDVDRNNELQVDVQRFAGVSIFGLAHGGDLGSPILGRVELGDRGLVYTPNNDASGKDTLQVVALADRGGDNRLFTIVFHVWKVFEANMGTQNAGLTLEIEGLRGAASTTVEGNGNAVVYGLPDGVYGASTSAPGKTAHCNKQTMTIWPNSRARQAPPPAGEFVADEAASLYEFTWMEDPSNLVVQGCEYASHVLEPAQLRDEGPAAPSPTYDSTATALLAEFGIHLMSPSIAVPGSISWTPALSYRLLRILRSLYLGDYFREIRPEMRTSKWHLTSNFVAGDIEYDESGRVLVSSQALGYTEPRMTTTHNGKRGAYFSLRLYHAVLKWATSGGKHAYINTIFQKRFGTSMDFIAHDIPTLTQWTTREDYTRFQDFFANERLILAGAFEEVPRGLHRVASLKNIIRRRDGTPHPYYGNVPAVAWPSSGYIEFLESGMHSSLGSVYLHSLVVHEKAHFVWEHNLNDDIKRRWMALSGWRKIGEEWYADASTTFVSAYAHAHNPNEDMAESIAAYVRTPEALQSRALAKYEFLRDFVMSGTTYQTVTRPDVTFEIYNLFPDYVFPGKIKRVHIAVQGAPDAGKKATIELQIHADSADQMLSVARFRLVPASGHGRLDVWCVPKPEAGSAVAPAESDTVYCEVEFGPTFATGNWYPKQIKFADAAGNERYQDADDYGWKLWINNPGEDTQPPQYVPNSARMNLGWIQSRRPDSDRSDWIQEVTLDIRYRENKELQHCMGVLVMVPRNTIARLTAFGHPSDRENCAVSFPMPQYMRRGTYELAALGLKDAAQKEQTTFFRSRYGDARVAEHFISDEFGASVGIWTPYPDSQPPFVDVAPGALRISVARGAGGGHDVSIGFRASDDNSGFRQARWTLLDPQGRRAISNLYAVIGVGEPRVYFPGDPRRLETYEVTLNIPISAPSGLWGVAELVAEDFAGNYYMYDFTEIVQVQDETSTRSAQAFNLA